MPVERDVTEAAGVVSDEVVEAVVSDAAAGGVGRVDEADPGTCFG